VPRSIVDNSDFAHSDPYYSRLFHNLAAQFFSSGNLKQYEPMMREKASQLLRDEPTIDAALNEYVYQMFCEIMFGYKGKYSEGMRTPEFMGEWLLPRSDPKKFLAVVHDDNRLSEKQIHDFIAVMWGETYSAAHGALRREIVRACRHPDLQDKASSAVNQKDLDDQILRFIVEEHRIDPSISGTIVRGPTIVMRHADFTHKEEIVGSDPQTFNPDRYQKLPSSWYGLPWMPFGNGGPNRCPGMEFHKYLSKQFLTELFLNYRLQGINDYGQVVIEDTGVNKLRKVIVSSRQAPTLIKTLHRP
jgi:cytochrome P450